MSKKVETFEVKVDGNETKKLAILQVNAEIDRKALRVYNQTFGEAVKSGAFLRAGLQKYVRDQGIWGDDKESEHQTLLNTIKENTDKLARGGIKLNEARQLALGVRDAREELRSLVEERTSMNVNTAEGQAENARFNCLVSLCTVDNETGEQYFKDTEDYISKSTIDPVAGESASRLARVLYNLDPSYEKNLPENKFLHKWKFVDSELRLINKEEHLVDLDGRLIDEEGRFIDENGDYVDRDGNPVTEEGDLKVEIQPFLDDDGNPMDEPVDESSTNDSDE